MRHSALRERLKYQASPLAMVLRKRFIVHMRDHQHLAGAGVGGDAGDKAGRVEFGLEHQTFLDVVGSAEDVDTGSPR